ncbi:MAG: pyridoxal phosphate-dependent aminotransferase [Alphaproteobacteria bacterium]|nr:MAG: pyridoxal phosphate-dependent aminotransferase [Alphaproteobacteria bacterium]
MTRLSPQAFGLDNISPTNPSLNFYDLRIGEPKLSPFPFNIFDKLHLHKNIHSYYPSHGDLTLRKMIVDMYYTQCSIDNVSVTHGALGAIDFIFRATLNSESEILIPDPGFPPYCKLAGFSGAKVSQYYLNLALNPETSINWEQLESLITDKTKLILINSPHNPTGKVLTETDFLRFQLLLKNHPQVSFILDEVYRDLIYDDKTHYDFSEFIDRGYIVGSFSKMYPVPGARVGWVLTSIEKMKNISPFLNNATGAISSFGQEIVKIIMNRKLSFKEKYSEAWNNVKEILDFHHVEYISPEGAFFVFIKYEINGFEATSELAELGVGVVPGGAFGEIGENYIRASFAQGDDVLENAFSIISKHWDKTHPRIIH